MAGESFGYTGGQFGYAPSADDAWSAALTEDGGLPLEDLPSWAPVAVPPIVAQAQRRRPLLVQTLSEDLTWDLIAVASARYPVHQLRRLSLPVADHLAVTAGQDIPNPVVPMVWSGPAIVVQAGRSAALQIEAGVGVEQPPTAATPTLLPFQLTLRPILSGVRPASGAIRGDDPLATVPVPETEVGQPGRVLRRPVGATPTPGYLPDVTAPAPPLSWGLPQALGGGTPAGDTTFSYQMLGLVQVPAEVLEQPWTQAPPVYGKPPVARTGSQRTDPPRVADVTASVPLGSWQPGYPGPPGPARLRQAPSLIWGVTTPVAVADVTQWAGSAPDLPPAKRPILYLLKATSGAAGFDLSTTARPAFGGMQIPGWRVVQYTGLVGHLTPDPVPTFAAASLVIAPARLRLRILGGLTRPELVIVTAVPTIDAWGPQVADGTDQAAWDSVASGWLPLELGG